MSLYAACEKLLYNYSIVSSLQTINNPHNNIMLIYQVWSIINLTRMCEELKINTIYFGSCYAISDISQCNNYTMSEDYMDIFYNEIGYGSVIVCYVTIKWHFHNVNSRHKALRICQILKNYIPFFHLMILFVTKWSLKKEECVISSLFSRNVNDIRF